VGPVALFAAERYCRRRQALLFIDVPGHWLSAADALRGQRERAFASANVAQCFPVLLEPAGDDRPHARQRRMSALGLMAAVIASREQGRQRVRDHQPRGGAAAALADAVVLRSRARPAVELDEDEALALIRSGLNVLLPGEPGSVELAGDVTLARGGDNRREWRSLHWRRRALAITSNIATSTRWAALQPPGPDTWQALQQQVGDFLAALTRAGELQGDSAHPGGYIKCDGETNFPGTGVAFIVGVALRRPGDYMAFRFVHRLDDCDITEVAWQPGFALAV
jgi:uncharacterized protein